MRETCSQQNSAGSRHVGRHPRTHKIGDMAEEYGVPMAMHFAGTPVSCMANVHCAAATLNFLALENHSLDVPWWSSMVQEGVKTPIVNHGWIEVPDRPGLGVTLNDDVVRQHLAPGTGYFEPDTPVGSGALVGPFVELVVDRKDGAGDRDRTGDIRILVRNPQKSTNFADVFLDVSV